MKALLRRSLVSVVGSVTLLFAANAFADGEACLNDTDCPGGGAVCGGDVCNWMKPHATVSGKYTCNPAGSQTPTGKDGWCTDNTNCKCAAQGAKCVFPYCTFTKASEAPAGSGGTGAGGGSGTAGAPSTAGTTSAAGTSSTAGTGTTPPASSDSGGCSVGGSSNSGAVTLALAMGALGLGVAFARRRR